MAPHRTPTPLRSGAMFPDVAVDSMVIDVPWREIPLYLILVRKQRIGRLECVWYRVTNENRTDLDSSARSIDPLTAVFRRAWRMFSRGIFFLLPQARELVDLATIGDQEISNDQVLYVVKRSGAMGGGKRSSSARCLSFCLSVCLSVCQVCLSAMSVDEDCLAWRYPFSCGQPCPSLIPSVFPRNMWVLF